MLRKRFLQTMFFFAMVSCFVASANADDGKWVSLFDGKSIDGWKKEGGYATYEAKDGMIVGTTAEGSKNTFLCKGPV